MNPYFLGGMGSSSPEHDHHADHHMHHGALFRDELMTVESNIHDWNSLVNIGEVPLSHAGAIGGNPHGTHHDDSYFNFDMKI